MTGLPSRLAGAPISWGVSEVPGWGHQLPPRRVLAEMRELGLTATELGPDGFLPDDPAEKVRMLAAYDLAAIAGFVPVVLHDRRVDPLPKIDRALESFVAAGAGTLVVAAAAGLDGYDERPMLDDAAWTTLLANLDRLAAHTATRRVRTTLHPHVGTVVERRDEVHRVLDGSLIPLCLDTGHLVIGGTDPGELVAQAADRIAHAHLKDVDARWAARVRSGEVSYTEAVRRGLYRPLGQGGVGIADVVGTLEARGYDGWYVMEQDTVLAAEPIGEGPLADVRTSVEYLRGLG